MPVLLDVVDMPTISGLATPSDFYTIFTDPAPLAGMRYPDRNTPWTELEKMGFKHLINLTGNPMSTSPHPLQVLKIVDLDDLYGGGLPRCPERDRAYIHEAAEAVVEKLMLGEGVIVHCEGGTGRTGTVLGCVLRMLGVPAEQVVAYLDRITWFRTDHGWPESPWQEEVVEAFPNGKFHD